MLKNSVNWAGTSIVNTVNLKGKCLGFTIKITKNVISQIFYEDTKKIPVHDKNYFPLSYICIFKYKVT